MARKHFEGAGRIRMSILRLMDSLRLAIWVLVLVPTICANPQLDEDRCELVVRSWAEKELATPQTQQKWTLRDLLFFLHIPRTGGRTYHQCFLKHLFGSEERCPKSYDRLRFDTSHPGCRLISTHDDYSILEKLPEGKASVVTNLRDPVGRVLSSYEFSVEVAARFLRHYKPRTNPRRPSATKMGRTKLISTLEIWPWKYLVPFMQKDIFKRRDAREAGQLKANVEDSFKNSYNAELLVMPFHEFINHPIAHELVHNGATFQVVGLTNNSYVKEAKEIRACVADYQHLGRWVLDVAKRRLDDMLYVGLTERQEESVAYFGNLLRGQISVHETAWDPQKTIHKRLLDDPHVPPISRTTVTSHGEKRYALHTSQASAYNRTSETTTEDIVDEVLESYQGCVKDLRYTQENRRTLSMELLAPINFTRMSRKLIPEDVIDQVVHLNSLDVELHSHAQLLFAKQQDVLHRGEHDELLEVHVTEEKPLHVSSEELNVGEKQKSQRQSVQQSSCTYFIGTAVLVTLSGFAVFIYILQKKQSLGERNAIRILHPLFTRVHEKI